LVSRLAARARRTTGKLSGLFCNVASSLVQRSIVYDSPSHMPDLPDISREMGSSLVYVLWLQCCHFLIVHLNGRQTDCSNMKQDRSILFLSIAR
jgi:hypothetical protein